VRLPNSLVSYTKILGVGNKGDCYTLRRKHTIKDRVSALMDELYNLRMCMF